MSNNFKSNLRSIILAGSLIASSSILADDGHARAYRKSLVNPVKKTALKVSNDIDFKILNSKYSSWGVDPSLNSSINLEAAWKKFKAKKEIIVAVVDTGIDPYHPFLKDNIHVPKGTPSATNYGVDFSLGSEKNKALPFDSHGHGTHVSGVLKSVFPKVKILPLKYYSAVASGKENLNSTIAALQYAVDQNVDIINYSSGGPKPDQAELRVLQEAQAKGILVVAAAGNEESNIDDKKNAFYPASYGLKNVITVTAHDMNLQVLSSSNYGKQTVDISAPGHKITSALPRHRAGELTGTSQATAFVSGVAAMIMSQYPNLTTPQVIKAIKESAKKEFTLARKCSTGGRLDAQKAQEIAKNMATNKAPLRNIASKKKGKIIYRVN